MELQLVPSLRADQIFQTDFWARFKEGSGWRAYRFKGSYQGQDFQLLALTRRVFLGLGFVYCPYGPELELSPSQWQPFLIRLAQALQEYVALSNFFARFDLPWLIKQQPRFNSGLLRSKVRIQPQTTVLLDLRPLQQQLLANMHRKWRYNIGLSQRRGVEVSSVSSDRLKEWYQLYRVTAARDRIGIHTFEYYRRLFETARDFPRQVQLELLLAEHEGQTLAGIIIAHCGHQTTYLYGASANHGREHMPNYLLQWTAICSAQARGSLCYDFFGVPDTPDPQHPMAGLYRFKTGFGGQICHRLGVCDYPYSKIFFALFRAGEYIRTRYHQRRKKYR